MPANYVEYDWTVTAFNNLTTATTNYTTATWSTSANEPISTTKYTTFPATPTSSSISITAPITLPLNEVNPYVSDATTSQT